MIAFIDGNRDLYINDIASSVAYKLLSMVDSIMWSDESDMLIVLSDYKVYSYYYPKTIYIDRDLNNIAVDIKDDLNIGQNCEIYSFYSTQLAIRTQKGLIIYTK